MRNIVTLFTKAKNSEVQLVLTMEGPKVPSEGRKAREPRRVDLGSGAAWGPGD